MRYLLDTHVVLWFFDDVVKLLETALRIILDPANEKYVSIASAWEVAIKVGKGNLRFNGGVSRFFDVIYQNGFELLPITEAQVKWLETLPLIHRDPFDRLLVATAKVERMTILTADENIHQYDVSWSW